MEPVSSTAMTRREALATLGALGAAALAACVSDRPTETDDDGIPVDMVDFAFEPATLNIEVGDRVTWRNTGELVHTATCDPSKANDPSNVQVPDGAAAWDSGGVAVGGSFSRVFDQPGEYRYVCLPHEGVMQGTIIVS